MDKGKEEGNPHLQLQIPHEPPLHLSSTSCRVRECGNRDIRGQRGRTPARWPSSLACVLAFKLE